MLGYRLRVVSGYRTPAEQDKLYAQGRTEPGQIVTNLKGDDPKAMHCYGLAVDLVDERRGYDISWSEIGSLAKKLGMLWGGDWNSFPDKPHVQFMITYRYKLIGSKTEQIEKIISAASSWMLGYSIKLVEDNDNPDCVITFLEGQIAGGGAAIQNPKPYAITITIGDEYFTFPNGTKSFQGYIYQMLVHEILHCIYQDNGLGDIHDIEAKENLDLGQLFNENAVQYLYRHLTFLPKDNTIKNMKYIIDIKNNQYLLYEPFKIAFTIGDEIELKLLLSRGLIGEPERVEGLVGDYDGYIIYPLVNQERLRDIFNF